MIKLRHQQPSQWHRSLAEGIEGLWEPWMRRVGRLLEDEQLLDTVYEAQGERHPQSRIRGRMQTPADRCCEAAPKCKTMRFPVMQGTRFEEFENSVYLKNKVWPQETEGIRSAWAVK
ncbi:MAG: hypothetical protein ABSF15_12260 [Candidatus Sulfotelmatobacter sp.]|jgi:hypothetical protein